MTVDLMEKVQGLMTPEVIGKAAEATGESPDSTQKAIQGAVPTIFAGLLTHSVSTPAGAARAFGILKEGAKDGSGAGLMNKVFGDRSEAVTETLARSSGIKGSSASHLLTMALPMIVGLIGKHVLSNRLDPGGLSQLLLGHKKAIRDNPNTPPGLADALGVGSLSELGGGSAHVEEPHVGGVAASAPRATEPSGRALERPVAAAEKHSRWGAVLLPALLLGALAVWGIFSLTRSHGPTGVTEPQGNLPTMPSLRTPALPTIRSANPSANIPSVEPATPAEAPAAGPITLPGGKTLDVDPKGPEAEMVRYLGDSNMGLPHTFEFNDLNFDSATANLTPNSVRTVDDLGAILRAYPSARVRVEGHTDSSGDVAANQALSEGRATTLANMLAARGVGRDRIETTGLSQERPVAENQSEQGRALNRRVDVVLVDR